MSDGCEATLCSDKVDEGVQGSAHMVDNRPEGICNKNCRCQSNLKRI